MVRFTATIHQFEQQGEKTGWTYIEIPTDLTEELKPGNKKSFRVKGKLDSYAFSGVSLLPMGGGSFIMPLNAEIRKGIHKKKGAMVEVQMAEDKKFAIVMPDDLAACLEDEPKAKAGFEKLAPSHRNYYIKWIDSAKTEPTRTKRIAATINAMLNNLSYGEMIRSEREKQ
ncbi:Bacteriocin-protection, YdeI or OmpD-Associated [Filimonas lacunae]|uniref:Bacteriocin-protection, YdeI or OmpD-Associated n=1 Tax=Filimonas lacunae TaxID=477680 RepID=A0A173MM72_9BACT|nr:YdeI/OmpD-associated family protein [Filimonas lacunae]BAV08569.1 hypothetical protein FLA_4615 [Filimonas lacunae]SIS57326.1 Bacteriocin-protection, YdeI or OmpD-Associated [Filimonas lacunae]